MVLATFRTIAAAIVAVCLCGGPALAADTDFPTWLAGLKEEARVQGIAADTLEAAFAGTAPIPRVIELDRRQPEGTITFAKYVERVISTQRIKRGREMYARHRTLLDAIGKQYGVQPRFIVALWGIETDFGRNTGGFSVVDALATLAYDGRRSAYFRKELLAALRILDENHITPEKMRGSWAGAMGQTQFMPSSFLKYAQDQDGDGRRDIWTTPADVFASAAKYLSTVGWNPDQTWGREVKLPSGFDAVPLVGLDKKRSLADWKSLGVKRVDGGALPAAPLQASLVMPDGPGGRAFLVYDNFRTIMDWNRSTYFATTVGLLSDRIGAAE